MQNNKKQCKGCNAEVERLVAGLCKRCYQKEYRKKNPDKSKQYTKAYKEKYPEKVKMINKVYRESHKEQIKESKKVWEENNREKVRALSAKSQQKYRKMHKTEIKEYMRMYQSKRKSSDSMFKFIVGVRSLISQSFARHAKRKNEHTEQILGCTIDEFRKHIAAQFADGMTFENYGEWHLDHIKPLATAKTIEEIRDLCHYTNFQPLWAEDNLRKGAKLMYEAGENANED